MKRDVTLYGELEQWSVESFQLEAASSADSQGTTTCNPTDRAGGSCRLAADALKALSWAALSCSLDSRGGRQVGSSQRMPCRSCLMIGRAGICRAMTLKPARAKVEA